MLDSSVLEVAIGMSFVFLLLSLVASGVQEGLAAFMQLRSANLERGLRSLLSGDSLSDQLDLVDSIYNHGLVRGMYSDPKKDLNAEQGNFDAFIDSIRFGMRWLVGIRPEKEVSSRVTQQSILLPAYIPSRTFALAMIDLLDTNPKFGSQAMSSITQFLNDHHWKYRDNKAGEALLALAVRAEGDLTRFQTHLEDWYNDSMDRASGWYKRYTQRVLVVIGLTLAIAFNVDAVHVATVLYSNKDLRQQMLSVTDHYLSDAPQLGDPKAPVGGQELLDRLSASIGSYNQAVQTSLLPVGWKHSFSDYKNALKKNWGATVRKVLRCVPGWIITALAISLGASFWFDTLNKFMVVRSTVKPQEKSAVDPSKG